MSGGRESAAFPKGLITPSVCELLNLHRRRVGVLILSRPHLNDSLEVIKWSRLLLVPGDVFFTN